MKAVLADIFARFTAEVGQHDFASKVTRADCTNGSTKLSIVAPSRIAATLTQSVFDKFRLPKVKT